MTPWVKRLIGANVVVYLATSLNPAIVSYFYLVPAYILVRPWTVLTYMFLHAGFWHIAFNMLLLFFFGPRLEARLGSRGFITLYLLSGLVGALLSILTPYVAIVGASGAVYGVLFGFAWYWPRERIHIWGVLPVEARVLVIFAAIASLVLGVGGGGGIAHFAHLGGFLGAFLYLKWTGRFSAAARFKAKTNPAPKRTTGADAQRWAKISRDGLHPLNREELERLLQKIDQHGLSSLSDEEKGFLERLTTH
jgi:membrane associated rhomboid family serine protease